MFLVGFEKMADGRVKEYLPFNKQLTSVKEKRVMFMHMFNTYVDKELRFTKKEMHNGDNLYEIFQNKIEAMPNDEHSNKLARLIYNNKECKLFCDLDDMFLHFVYERAKLVNKNKSVLLGDKSILIQEKKKSTPPALLIPAYTQIDKKNLFQELTVKKHIKTVLNTLKETEIREIYLIYPKHPEFKRYIPVKLLDKIPLNKDEYSVKVVPYSFSFCTRMQKKTTHIRRQKCR